MKPFKQFSMYDENANISYFNHSETLFSKISKELARQIEAGVRASNYSKKPVFKGMKEETDYRGNKTYHIVIELEDI